MSSNWQILRTAVIADLGTTDPDFEATQPATLPDGWGVVSPQRLQGGGSHEPVSEYALQFLAYDVSHAIVAGTIDFQVIEVAPEGDQTVKELTGLPLIFIGQTPVNGWVLGRRFTFPARYLHKFGVRIVSVSAGAATTVRVRWSAMR